MIKIPEPKYYENPYHTQSIEKFLCNVLVYESYWNNKSDGLTVQEVAKISDLPEDTILKEIKMSNELVEHKGKIVKKTWLAFPNHFLAIKEK